MNKKVDTGGTVKSPAAIIEEIKQINQDLRRAELDYYNLKYKYESDFYNLKYGPEYEKYKTIKEKEERAKLELGSDKQNLNAIKVIINSLERERDLLMLEFNYYSAAGGCCGCND